MLPAFLRSDAAAFRWVEKNIDMDLSEWNLEMEDVIARAHAYADFARSAQRSRFVDIYRAVRAPRIADVHLMNLGKYWSRYAKTAASYAGASEWKPTKGGKMILSQLWNELLIHGRVSPNGVDWTEGFKAFIFYGEHQWEVTLLPNVPVWVVSIRDRDTGSRKVFNPAAQGNSGFKEIGEDGWQPTPTAVPQWRNSPSPK
jgi:hypothetical protein